MSQLQFGVLHCRFCASGMNHLSKGFFQYVLRFSLFSAWSSLSHEDSKAENAINEKSASGKTRKFLLILRFCTLKTIFLKCMVWSVLPQQTISLAWLRISDGTLQKSPYLQRFLLSHLYQR